MKNKDVAQTQRLSVLSPAPDVSLYLFRIISLFNQMIPAPTGPVDYSDLPESLRYIKRKQGSLKWRKTSPGATSLSKMYLNRNFWKDLRYCMPSAQVRKPQIEMGTRMGSP